MQSNQYNSDSIKTEITERIALGRQQVKEGKVTIIDDSYFDKAREYIKNKFMPNSTHSNQ